MDTKEHEWERRGECFLVTKFSGYQDPDRGMPHAKVATDAKQFTRSPVVVGEKFCWDGVQGVISRYKA